jgi:hypothetical protein
MIELNQSFDLKVETHSCLDGVALGLQAPAG